LVKSTPNNRKHLDRWLRPVSATARAQIKALQPYQRRPSDPTTDLLWLLSELDNVDKHRLLVVVNPKLAELELEVLIDGKAKTFPVSNRPGWGRLEQSAIPVRVTVPNDPTKPETKVQVNAHTLTGVVFSQAGMECDGREVAPPQRSDSPSARTSGMSGTGRRPHASRSVANGAPLSAAPSSPMPGATSS
jgi:hypothetical protein